MKRTAFMVLVVLLVVGCPKKNNAPDTPSVPSGPSSVAKNSTASFASAATDPDNDSVSIRFDWGDGATSDWSNWVASGDTVAMLHLWADSGTFQLKTQAKDWQDSTSAWSAALAVSVTPNHPPNTPAVPAGPSTAPKDSVCQFTASATDPDGDSVSYRFAWGNGDTSAWGGWTQNGSTSGAGYAYPRSGSFQVRAQARDADDARSAWSDPLSVAIRNPYAPTTPSAPVGPDSGRLHDTLGFSSTASDSGGDSVSIRFSWGDGDTSEWSTLVRSGDTVRMTHAWQNADSFLAGAQARDEEGLTSSWSSLSTVTITRLKWRYQTDSVIFSSPVIADDGTVCVGSWDGHLYAVNRDGSLKWSYQTGGSVNCSPALAADGTVYVGSFDGYLYAINPDGSLKWRYQTGDYVGSSPAVAADGTVYVGSFDGYFYAIGPDGSLKWRCQTRGYIHSSPAIAADGTVYVGSSDSCLYAINPDSSLKWRYLTGGDISSSPAVAADGTVYVGSSDGYFHGINPDGSLKWRYQTGGYVGSSPAVAADGTVYVGSANNYLYAIVGDSPLADSPWPKFHHDNKNTGRVGGGQR